MRDRPYSWIFTAILVLVGLSIALTGSVAAQSADIVVATDGSGGYTSIQNAVDNSADGDRIKVKPGTYKQPVFISKNITLIAPEGATITNTSATESSAGIRLFNDAKANISGFVLNDWYFGVTAFDTTGNWIVQDTIINDSSSRGISADGSTGDWRIKNVTIIGNPAADESDGIDAGGTSGSWLITNSTIRAVGEDGISVDASSGDWSIRNTTINATRHSVDAFETSGNWTITSAVLMSSKNDRAVVNADNTTGNWKINSSILTDGTGIAINSDDSTQGKATYNYWGATDGPSGEFCGAGGEINGNVTMYPYYTDSSLTTLSSATTSGTVQISRSCLIPEDITASSEQELVLTLSQISADGQSDNITITMPEDVSVENVGEPRAIGTPYEVDVTSTGDPIKLEVDPDEPEATVDFVLRVPVELSSNEE